MLTANRDARAWDEFTAPEEIDAANRLIAAGLIEEYGGALQATRRCDTTFGYTSRLEPPRLSALYSR